MHWIPLLDYAMKSGVSLSTLRRHIKANKIQFKVENGRYLLLDDTAEGTGTAATPAATAAAVLHFDSSESQTVRFQVVDLERKLEKAHEEIAELKMLVALYEEKLAPQPNPRRPDN